MSVTFISLCTLLPWLTQNIPLVTVVVTLSTYHRFAALETYTPFGIPLPTITAATPSW
jgi:hypothetical protein